MKKNIILTLIVCSLAGYTTIYAQEQNTKQGEASAYSDTLESPSVPDHVIQHFQELNGKDTEVKWKSDNDEMVGSFKNKDHDSQSYYSKDGTWKGTRSAYSNDQLPAQVRDYMTRNYKGYNIDNVYQIQDPGGRYYQVHATQGNRNETLRFDEEGKYMNEWDEARELPGSSEDNTKN